MNLPDDGDDISASDFTFKVGTSSTPSSWSTLSSSVSVSVEADAGTNGVDRVFIAFPDNAIQNEWLQVTVKANSNTTGLSNDDVFYLGKIDRRRQWRFQRHHQWLK